MCQYAASFFLPALFATACPTVLKGMRLGIGTVSPVLALCWAQSPRPGSWDEMLQDEGGSFAGVVHLCQARGAQWPETLLTFNF